MREVVEFEGAPPDLDAEPLPFAITMHRVDGSGKERQTFEAKPPGQVSYGALVVAGTDALELFRRIVVTTNTAPDGPTDTRSEFERLRDFLDADDLTIDGPTLSKIAEELVGEYADVPTRRSTRSAATRKTTARGSVAKPRRPASR